MFYDLITPRPPSDSLQFFFQPRVFIDLFLSSFFFLLSLTGYKLLTFFPLLIPKWECPSRVFWCSSFTHNLPSRCSCRDTDRENKERVAETRPFPRCSLTCSCEVMRAQRGRWICFCWVCFTSRWTFYTLWFIHSMLHIRRHLTLQTTWQQTRWLMFYGIVILKIFPKTLVLWDNTDLLSRTGNIILFYILLVVVSTVHMFHTNIYIYMNV